MYYGSKKTQRQKRREKSSDSNPITNKRILNSSVPNDFAEFHKSSIVTFQVMQPQQTFDIQTDSAVICYLPPLPEKTRAVPNILFVFYSVWIVGRIV